MIFYVTDDADPVRAEELSRKLNIEISREPAGDQLMLRLDGEGLSLVKGNLEMHGDFSKNVKRIKQGVLHSELLVKAAKLKNAGAFPVAVDATAGMGEDSLLLAAAGFQVNMYEFDPVIAALLGDTIERAKKIPELSAIALRMHVFPENSAEAMTKLDYRPDIILLDPMFPERTKSASVKKKFQLLHELERPCSAEEELVNAAIAAHPKKIVIKRPVKGPFLAGIKPEYSLGGKAIRYDVLVFHENINGTV